MASLVAASGSLGVAGHWRLAARSTRAVVDRARSSARSTSGALMISASSWLAAWVRALMAERLATRRARMASTRHRALWGCLRLAAQGGPGGGLGVDRIGLALAPAGLPVGPVDLDHLEVGGPQVAG